MATLFVSPAVCPHLRTREHCEDCRVADASQRGDYVPTPVTAGPAPELELADHDVYLDHGDNRYTYIGKGDAIPRALAALPRVPVQPHPDEQQDKPPPRRRR